MWQPELSEDIRLWTASRYLTQMCSAQHPKMWVLRCRWSILLTLVSPHSDRPSLLEECEAVGGRVQQRSSAALLPDPVQRGQRRGLPGPGGPLRHHQLQDLQVGAAGCAEDRRGTSFQVSRPRRSGASRVSPLFLTVCLLPDPTWRLRSLYPRTRLANTPTKSCCIPTPAWKSCAGCSSYKIWWTPWRCASNICHFPSWTRDTGREAKLCSLSCQYRSIRRSPYQKLCVGCSVMLNPVCVFQFAVLMWLLTYVGALFNGLTLLILGEIILHQSVKSLRHCVKLSDYALKAEQYLLVFPVYTR